MSTNFASPKITPEHLVRRALVYVRQSTLRQARENLESQRLQYALVDRANALGWTSPEVVDADLGASAGPGARERAGFRYVVGQVALGEVGIILSREASRLSRTDKDWCQLLEVCQLFGTLIADEEQVYDPDLTDDQLILGIKGTLSVVELRVLRLRMDQGRREKARRGELRMRLPTGYVYGLDGSVCKDPDLRVQEAIALVFQKFRECGTVRQTFKWFADEEVELPVQVFSARGAQWQRPRLSFVGSLLTNPFYAGAYCVGRKPVERAVREGRLVKRRGALRRPEDCAVFLPGHHETYIEWEVFETNQKIIRRNSWSGDDAARSVRAGQCLLAGLLRCGRCGRMLHVRYWGRSGTNARYLCKGTFDSGGDYCQSFAGRQIDERFAQELLKVISPLGIEASLKALDELDDGRRAQRSLLERKVEQLSYEVTRAREQYDEVDARNRLVASELERRWNDKLEALLQAKSGMEEFDLSSRDVTDTERQRVRLLGECFADVWMNGACSMKLKKQMARAVVEELIVTPDGENVNLDVVVHWKGGAHTRFSMERPRQRKGPTTAAAAVEIIEKMAPRYGDDQIAGVLNRHGLRTVRGLRWTVERVATVRTRHGIEGHRSAKRDPEVLSMVEAARLAGMSNRTFERLNDLGLLTMRQVVPFAPWEIRRSDLESARVQGILEHFRRTGRLPTGPVPAQGQLFPNEGADQVPAHDDSRPPA